jgi:hypothetical protein
LVVHGYGRLRQERSEPLEAWIEGPVLVPLDHLLHPRHFDRHRSYLQGQRLSGLAGQPGMHRRDTLGADDELRQRSEAEAGDFNAPLHAMLMHQPAFERWAAAHGLHHRVTGGDVVVQCDLRLARQPAAAPNDADKFLIEKQFGRMLRRGIAVRNDEQVDFALVECPLGLLGLGQQLEANAGCLLRCEADGGGHQRCKGEIRDEDPELAIARERVEGRLRDDCRIDPQQHVADRFAQSLGSGCQVHSPTHLYDEIVVEVLAKPGQRIAERGLAHEHPLGGAADAALRQDRIQRDQQVEVQLVEAHIGRPSSSVPRILRGSIDRALTVDSVVARPGKRVFACTGALSATGPSNVRFCSP